MSEHLADESPRSTGSELSPLTSLRQTRPGSFAESSPLYDDGLPRHYGGRSLAQAARAAGLTVDDALELHSLHASFLVGGEVGVPVAIDVESLRDSRSFSTRSVDSRQGDRHLLHAVVSFHRPEPGDAWDPHPDQPLPERVESSAAELASPLRGFDVRAADGVSELGWPRHPWWVRAREAVDPDPRVHACLLAYVSDAGLVWATRHLGSAGLVGRQLASLDHALWVHQAPRMDQWLLFEADPVVNGGGRGLISARFRDREGRLVATVVQESLFRDRGSRAGVSSSAIP